MQDRCRVQSRAAGAERSNTHKPSTGLKNKPFSLHIEQKENISDIFKLFSILKREEANKN